MMLQALIAYAEREGLGDSDFENIGVRWGIPLTLAGDLAGPPIALEEGEEDKKKRPRQMSRAFTSANELNQGTKAHFLCDTLERAVLLPDPKAPGKAAARRVQNEYFQALLAEASAATPAMAGKLAAVQRFLREPAQVAELHAGLLAAKAKTTDNATFLVAGENLLAAEELRVFWRERRARQAALGGAQEDRMCLATGTTGPTLKTTEKIKGVPGGLATGTNLISFDKDSFCSHGLEQAQNAALSAPAELKIRAALNALIAKSRSQALVFNDTVHLHWTRRADLGDPYELLSGADPEGIKALLESFRAGMRPVDLDATEYYAVSLSGNGARIVVRDWLESTVPEIKTNVAKWFTDLAIVEPDGGRVRPDFKFAALLYGLVRAELADLPAALPTQMLRSALAGLPLPHAALFAALRRQQLDENKLNPARMALIKACLRRMDCENLGKSETKPDIMTEQLNPECRNPAYLCGRLLGVFDRLQYLALDGVNAGVVERFYASACVTPALVMGRLFRNAQFHLGKAEGGTAANVTKDFEEISAALGASFPPTLDLEGQGRFALGYYHQKAEYRRRTAEWKEKNGKSNPAKSDQPA